MNGQDEPNSLLWLATRAGKLEIYLAHTGLPTVTCKKIVFFSKINPLNEPVLRSSELLLRALLYVNENDTLVVGEIWVVGKKD